MTVLSARCGSHELTLDGRTAGVDGRSVLLTPQQAAVLAALLLSPGRVLSRAELLAAAWDRTQLGEPADEHAVEMAVTRLRAALGPAGRVVQTVVKRGYRLAAAQG